MFVEVVRLFTVLLGVAGGFWLARDLGAEPGSNIEGLAGVLGCLAGYVGGGIIGRLIERAVGVVDRTAQKMPPTRFVASAIGGALGGILGALCAVPVLVLLPLRVGLVVFGLVVFVVGFTGARVLGHQTDAIVEMLGLSTRPLVRAKAFDARDGMLADTSVLMDGQLLALARTGLLGGDLLVPRFVLDELQGLSDARDGTRARRAQRGLEMLEVLRREGTMRVYVLDDEVPEFAEVDAKLVALARRLELRLLTNDAPLSRSAELQGVPTCNLRRLVAELAPAVVPGDHVRVALTRAGREPRQGVGHLDDGSMVVVNDGEDLVGNGEVELQVTSVVPTSMGRILFATPDEAVAVP
jgi:uncharacterized protein YacL